MCRARCWWGSERARARDRASSRHRAAPPTPPTHSTLTPTHAAVVDNLPVVPEEKYEKLLTVLKKIYGQIGHVREGERVV